MRTLLSLLLTVGLFVPTTAVVHAEDTNGGPDAAMQHVTPSATRTAGENAYRIATSTAARITALQQLGTLLATNRTTDLTKAMTTLQSMQRLSTDTRTQLVAQVQTNISDLTALQEKIAGDTDLETIKTDVRSIITAYRVYIVVLPQVRGLAVVDRLQSFTQTLTTLQTRIQTKTTELKSAGNDTSAIQSNIDQAAAKMTEAQAAITRAETSFTDMQVDDPTGSTTLKATGQAQLQIARQDLRQARESLVKAITLLKSMIANTSTNTNTVLNGNAS